MVWQDFEQLLDISYPQLNDQYAVNCASLGFGSIMFIPLALKFGRRPVYLLTALIIFITAIWQALLRDFGNMLAAQIFNGLACAVCWTLVPVTVRFPSTSLRYGGYANVPKDYRPLFRTSARKNQRYLSVDE